MIKVYLLPVERINNTDKVKGSEYIHNAVVECTKKPDVRKLIQDTTPAENTALLLVALKVRNPTPKETSAFEALPAPTPLARDLAAEIDELRSENTDIRARLKRAGIA